MTPVFQPLETVTRTAPLGLRCVDITTEALVAGGLTITATPRERRARPVPARLTRSGVYALHNLPGLVDFEFANEASPSSSPPASPPGREFVVLVEDAESRFLPYAMRLTLPRRNLMTTYLFSAPGRARVTGLTAIRGGLKDSTRQLADGSLRPAAFARIVAEYETTSPPTIYVALADWRGEFALFLPEPNPLQPPAGVPVSSPNTAGRRTISELRWPLTLRFFYEPQAQQFVTADERGRVEILTGQQDGLTDAPPAQGRVPYFPLLTSLLNQSEASVIEVAGASGPAAAALLTEIEYGKELVVRTREANDSGVWLVPPAIVSP